MATETLNPSTGDAMPDTAADELLQIKCDKCIYQVPKEKMCKESRAVSKAMADNFRENATGSFEINGFPQNAVKAVIEYVNTGDYNFTDGAIAQHAKQPEEEDGTSSNNEGTEDGDGKPRGMPPIPTKEEAFTETLFHASINSLADYLQMEELRTLTKKKMRHAWDAGHFEVFFEFLTEWYEKCNNNDLRDTLLDITADLIDRIIYRDAFLQMDLPVSFWRNLLSLVLKKIQEKTKEILTRPQPGSLKSMDDEENKYIDDWPECEKCKEKRGLRFKRLCVGQTCILDCAICRNEQECENNKIFTTSVMAFGPGCVQN
ncbi:hypothetical protein KEM55_001863 [Ascosphaera atra]|nr:hypothetical protein KEM55_001863 [Ascosphaera atra]